MNITEQDFHHAIRAVLLHDEFKCFYNSVPYSDCEMNHHKQEIGMRLGLDTLRDLKDQRYGSDVQFAIKA